MAENIELFKVDIDYGSVVDETAALTEQLIDLKKQLKTESDVKEQVKLKAQIKAVNSEIRRNERYLQKKIVAENANTDSIEDTRKQLALVSAEWAKEAKAYGENTERAKELTDQKLMLTDVLRAEESATGDNRRGVGGYTEATAELTEGMDVLQGSMSNVIGNLIELQNQEGGIKSFFTSFLNGIKTVTRASLKFIMTPIGAVLAAIVVAIAAVNKAIEQDQRLADEWAATWSGVSNVIDKLIGQFGQFGTTLIKAFTDPKKALEDLAKAVLDNVIKKFTGLFDIAKGLATFMSGDFKKGLTDVTDGFFKMTIGVEDITKKYEDLSKEMKLAYDIGKQLQVMQTEYDEALISTTQTLAELEAREKELALIEGDGTKSLKERQAANIELTEVQRKMANTRIQLAKLEFSIAQKQYDNQLTLKGKVTRADRKALADAKANLIKETAEANNIIADGYKRKREIQEADVKVELDNLIDGFDQTKTTNEKIINNTRLSLDMRKKIFKDLTVEGERAFNDQIEAIERYAGINIDQNKLIEESDAKRINEQIQSINISEDLQGRLLEIFRERKAQIRDFYDLEIALSDESIQKQLDNNELSRAIYENARSRAIAVQTKFNQKQLTEDLEFYGQQQQQEQEALDIQRENGLITQEAYLIAREELNQKYFDLALAATEEDTARIREVQETNYNNQIAALEDSQFAKLELQKQYLATQEALEIEAAEKIGADTTLIREKYAKQQEAIERQKRDIILDVSQGMVQNIGSLFAEGSMANKAFAAFDARINTYRAAQAAYASGAAINPAIGVAAAAAATVAGLANVKKILSASPSNSGGGGGGVSSPTAGIAQANENINPTNIVNRNTTQDTETKVVPVLVTDEVTSKQKTQTNSEKLAVL